jgi:hypothetical protein
MALRSLIPLAGCGKTPVFRGSHESLMQILKACASQVVLETLKRLDLRLVLPLRSRAGGQRQRDGGDKSIAC